MPTTTTPGRGAWSPRIDSRASTVVSSTRSSAPSERSATGTPRASAATTASRTRRSRRWRARTVRGRRSAVRQEREVVADRQRGVALQRHGREGVAVTPVLPQVAATRARHVDVHRARPVRADAQVGTAVGGVVAVDEDGAGALPVAGAGGADPDDPVAVDADRLRLDPD